ncbi:MAG: glycosyltransferase family 1 protein [Leptospiraceae bacterium]|nr:glycosyltransferase family 1 protein [Leptospiraceae bacterium]
MQADNRLKIDVVTETFLPELNGVSRSLDRMIRGIEDRGHDVQVFRPVQSADGQRSVRIALDSVSGMGQPCMSQSKNHHLSMGLRMPFYREVQVGLASPHFFRARFRKRRPDLVHVVTEGPLGLMAMIAASSMGIPVLSDYRTHFHKYFEYYGMGKLGRWVHRYLRLFHNLTRRTLVPTASMKSELMEFGFKRVSVIGRGVDTEAYGPHHRCDDLRKSHGIAPETHIVLYAGRIAPEKNVDLAIRSFRAMKECHPNMQMILVGDGPRKASLQAANPDLIFTGFQSGVALSRYYASADIFLFPSVTDTFGNVVTEAAASGLAVVAFDRGAAGELLEHEKSGWVIPGEDDSDYMAACTDLALRIGSAQSPIPEIRMRAREAACAVGWDSIVGRLEECYYESLVRKVRFRQRIQWRMRRVGSPL